MKFLSLAHAFVIGALALWALICIAGLLAWAAWMLVAYYNFTGPFVLFLTVLGGSFGVALHRRYSQP